jgi:hypothetical protein
MNLTNPKNGNPMKETVKIDKRIFELQEQISDIIAEGRYVMCTGFDLGRMQQINSKMNEILGLIVLLEALKEQRN